MNLSITRMLVWAWTVPTVWGQTPVPPNPPSPPASPMAAAPRALQIRGSYLGIGIQEMTVERARELKLPEPAGVEISRIADGSPAEKAGLKVGDVVLQYNGTRVQGIEQFSRLVRETPAGRDAKIDVLRGGVTQTIAARIGQHPSLRGFSFPDEFSIRLPDMPRVIVGTRSPLLGVEAEPVDGQLAQYFGVKEGVLVRSVTKDSTAERAGIKAGDVILRIGEERVATPREITSRLRPLAGKSAQVSLMRDKQEMAISVTLEPSSGAVGKSGRSQFLNPDE